MDTSSNEQPKESDPKPILRQNMTELADSEMVENQEDLVKSKRQRQFKVQTDHSVVIIGWGSSKNTEGEDQPFWIVRNSFGTEWGNQGDFQVARGSNDFGIEEEVSGFFVRQCDKEVAESQGECVFVEPS